MTEAHTITMPPGGWTVDDLDSWPETHVRYELTDRALTVSPSPSSLHQAVAIRLGARLDELAPPTQPVTQAVEIGSPRSHTEDRVTKPAIHARHGIPHYRRVELEPLRIRLHRLGAGDGYRETGGGEERRTAGEPFDVDVPLPDLLPRWAR